MRSFEWAAGLFEGEGCFSRGGWSKNGTEYKQFVATIEMVDEDVIRDFHEVVSIGSVTHMEGRTRKAGQINKDTWRWKVGSHDDFRNFAEAMLPYMGKRRAARINELLEEQVAYRERLDLRRKENKSTN